MEYKNSDILLYSVKDGKKIVVIYNNKEQMDKYLNSGDSKDAPIKVFNYSKQLENELTNDMKKIDHYDIIKFEGYPEKLGDTPEEALELINKRNKLSNIKVSYKDGTEYTFAGSNLGTIKTIKNAQDNLTKERIIGDFAKLPEEEKTAIKSKAVKKGNKGLAYTLAALILAGTALIHTGKGGKILNNISESIFNNNEPGAEDTLSTPTPTAFVGDETQISKTELKNLSKNLYDDIINKKAYILRYQQFTKVNVDEDLAYSIVELINGIYPTRLTTMTDGQMHEEMFEIREAIALITSGSLDIDTPASEMVNLSDYIKNPTQKALVNNTLMVAKGVSNESIGEPLYGKIIDDYQSINVFSKEYNNAVDLLLNYEWETMNSTEFYQAPVGTRTVVTSIWQYIGMSIPQWSYTMRESSEFEPREHKLYYKYFIDEATNIPYYPRESVSGESEYVKTYQDEKGCHEEVYTEAEMFAIAGLLDTVQVQNTGIEINPNVHQYGLAVEIDNRQKEQDAVLYSGKQEIVVIPSENIDSNNDKTK